MKTGHPTAGATTSAVNRRRQRFTAISGGNDFTCALSFDGSPVCWGYDSQGQSPPPLGLRLSSVTISSGRSRAGHACGLRTEDGGAVCWGNDDHGQASPPMAGSLVGISAGTQHTCALRSDGAPVCWGKDDAGQASPPAGETFVAITSGKEHTCGLRADGIPVCWGADDLGGQATPPQSERFSSISAGEDFTCALRKDGTPVCWGKEHTYRELDQRSLASVGDETFTSIATGTDHACALREDGAISCWGDNSVGQATPPPGLYVAVTAGDQSGCAITVDGELTCWGVSRGDPELSPEGRRYVSITSSESYTCTLKENGLADCWGGEGYWTVPQEEFISIRSAGNYACGLREDGTVRCWGYEPYERLFPRDARFASLGTGAHDCGIAEDGAVLCWDPERQDRREGFTCGQWGRRLSEQRALRAGLATGRREIFGGHRRPFTHLRPQRGRSSRVLGPQDRDEPGPLVWPGITARRRALQVHLSRPSLHLWVAPRRHCRLLGQGPPHSGAGTHRIQGRTRRELRIRRHGLGIQLWPSR